MKRITEKHAEDVVQREHAFAKTKAALEAELEQLSNDVVRSFNESETTSNGAREREKAFQEREAAVRRLHTDLEQAKNALAAV